METLWVCLAILASGTAVAGKGLPCSTGDDGELLVYPTGSDGTGFSMPNPEFVRWNETSLYTGLSKPPAYLDVTVDHAQLYFALNGNPDDPSTGEAVLSPAGCTYPGGGHIVLMATDVAGTPTVFHVGAGMLTFSHDTTVVGEVVGDHRARSRYHPLPSVGDPSAP